MAPCLLLHVSQSRTWDCCKHSAGIFPTCPGSSNIACPYPPCLLSGKNLSWLSVLITVACQGLAPRYKTSAKLCFVEALSSCLGVVTRPVNFASGWLSIALHSTPYGTNLLVLPSSSLLLLLHGLVEQNLIPHDLPHIFLLWNPSGKN